MRSDRAPQSAIPGSAKRRAVGVRWVRPQAFRFAGALLVSSVALMGCAVSSSADSTDSADAEAISQTATAIVMIERTSGPGEALHGDAVVARFLRVQQGAVDEQALRVVGAWEELPPPGTCMTIGPSRGELGELRAPVSGPARSVELLDVGTITLTDLEAPGVQGKDLVPRTMPDPTGVVSGVIYSAHASDAFTAGGRVDLRVSGGPDLADAFTAQFSSPRDVSGVGLTQTDAGIDVTWDGADGDARDLVYVELLSPASVVLARCSASEAGHALIPFATVGVTPDDGQVAVHRLHRESFRGAQTTRGKRLVEGEIRFNTARVVTYAR